MASGQFDLFDPPAEAPSADAAAHRQPVDPGDLSDEALIQALQDDTGAAVACAAEAGRRRLVAAVPVLAALCRRFAGFGREKPVPEQIAALRALAAIGGAEARTSAGQLVAGNIVEQATLPIALEAAVTLGAPVPAAVVASGLSHRDATARAAACRCAGPGQITPLLERLDDLDHPRAGQVAGRLRSLGAVGPS